MLKNYLIFLLLFVSTCTYAQDFSDIEITVHKVNENLHVLFGAGGNIAVLTGPEGTVMVDDQFAQLSEKISASINSISTNPIKYLINTHWHGDHTGGNSNFAKKGATIIAHDNVRERLMKQQIRPFGRSTDAAPAEAWPRLTFNDEMQVHHNGITIQLLHHDAAHTDGDAMVYFLEYNVLHMGDLFFKGKFPFVDTELGGNPDGIIAAVDAALLLADVDTVIIPGHGSVSNKEDLRNYHQMLLIIRDRIKAILAKGTLLDEVDVDAVVKGFDGWGDGFIKSDRYVKTLYDFYSEQQEEEKTEDQN